MEIREMLDLVKTNGSGTYKVTYKNGKSEKVRLFYRQGGDYLCEFKRGSSRYGFYFVLDDVVSIELPVSKSENEIFRHTLKRLIKSLEESGLCGIMRQKYHVDKGHFYEKNVVRHQSVRRDAEGKPGSDGDPYGLQPGGLPGGGAHYGRPRGL